MLDPKTHSAIISAHVKRADKEHAEWDRYRRLYRCENWNIQASDPSTTGVQEDPLVAETGSMYAFVDTMLASIIPTNPQVNLLARRKELQEAARAQQTLANWILDYTKAKTILRRHGAMASVYPRGILKAVWRASTKKVKYIPLDPRFFFYDLTQTDWEDIRYCIEVTVLTEAEFKDRCADKELNYNKDLAERARGTTYPKWLRNPEGQMIGTPNTYEVFKWIVVYEFFDFTQPGGGKVFHYLENTDEPLFTGDLPYVFLRNPYHKTVFNDNLEDSGGLADTKLVEMPIRRYDEMATLEIRFAQSAIPSTVLNTNLVDDIEEAADKLGKANGPWSIVPLDVKQDKSIDEALGQTPVPTLTPSFTAAKEALLNEITFRLGMPDYTRGVVGQSDIATEFALVDATLKTRQGNRSDIIYEAIEWMAKAGISLYEEFLDPNDPIYARLADGNYTEIFRHQAGLRDPRMAEAALAGGDPIDPLDIDYRAIPYSPAENSKPVRLQKLTQYLDGIRASPNFDQYKIDATLADLLDIPDTLKPAAPAQPNPVGGGQPNGPVMSPGQPEAPPPTPIQSAVGGETPNTVSPNPPDVSARAGMAGGAGHPTPAMKV